MGRKSKVSLDDSRCCLPGIPEIGRSAGQPDTTHGTSNFSNTSPGNSGGRLDIETALDAQQAGELATRLSREAWVFGGGLIAGATEKALQDPGGTAVEGACAAALGAGLAALSAAETPAIAGATIAAGAGLSAKWAWDLLNPLDVRNQIRNYWVEQAFRDVWNHEDPQTVACNFEESKSELGSFGLDLSLGLLSGVAARTGAGRILARELIGQGQGWLNADGITLKFGPSALKACPIGLAALPVGRGTENCENPAWRSASVWQDSCLGAAYFRFAGVARAPEIKPLSARLPAEQARLHQAIDEELNSPRLADLKDLLVRERLILPQINWQRADSIAGWLQELAARPYEFKHSMGTLPKPRLTWDLSKLFDQSNLVLVGNNGKKIALSRLHVYGQGIEYGDKAIVVDLKNGGVLKIVTTAPQANCWDARLLSDVKKLQLSRGYTMHCYVQEKLTVPRNGVIPKPELDRLGCRINAAGKELMGDCLGQFGQDCQGNWRLLDSSLVVEPKQAQLAAARSCAIDNPNLANLRNLEAALVDSGEIPAVSNPQLKQPVCISLKEMLARPQEFGHIPGPLIDAHRGRLWALSQYFQSTELESRGEDLRMGGESIVVPVPAGVNFQGHILAADAVVKATFPQYARCLDPRKSGTYPWEAARLSAITRMEVGGQTCWIYAQEKLDPRPAPDWVVNDMEQQAQHAGRRFYDHNSPQELQFGLDKQGRWKLMDWSAMMDADYFDVQMRNDNKGGQY